MAVSLDERMKLRNNLGETFGTKKAKAAIRAQERNRVDVDAMRGVAGHLQDRIQENTESLPTLGVCCECREAYESDTILKRKQKRQLTPVG